MDRDITRPSILATHGSDSQVTQAPPTAARPRATFMIIDDQPVTAFAMSSLITAQPQWQVVAQASTIVEARSLCATARPSAVLLGVIHPREVEFEFLAWLRDHLPSTIAIVYSVQPEAIYAQSCIRAGASAYVGKEASIELLLYTLTLALNGETVVNGHVVDRLTAHFVRSSTAEGLASLSQRELEILHLLGEGMSTRRISELLCRSTKTIESHRYRIGRKLNISSGTELVHFALRHQIASAALAPCQAA